MDFLTKEVLTGLKWAKYVLAELTSKGRKQEDLECKEDGVRCDVEPHSEHLHSPSKDVFAKGTETVFCQGDQRIE